VRRTLLTCCAPPLIAAMDFALLAVAAPVAAREASLSDETVAWLFGAFSLPFGALLLLSGRVGGRVGRVRMVRLGLLVFAAGAAAVALGRSPAALLAGRALQGIGAALMTPAALAQLTAAFTDADARRRALAAYGTSVAAGFTCGALAGGALVAAAGWRAAVTAEALAAVAAAACAAGPGTRTGGPDAAAAAGLDVRGALGCGAVVLVAALVAGGTLPPAAGLVALGLVVPALLAHERRVCAPLLAPALLRRAATLRGALGGALVTATGVPAVVLVTLYLEDVRSSTPLEAGLLLACFGAAAPLARRASAGRVARAPRRLLASGLAVQGAAIAALHPLAAVAWPAGLGAALAVFGAGHVAANAGAAMTVTHAVPAELCDDAAALLATAQYAGAACGPLALLPAGGGTLPAGALACAAAVTVALPWRAPARRRRARATARPPR
jgi:MFS family permease